MPILQKRFLLLIISKSMGRIMYMGVSKQLG